MDEETVRAFRRYDRIRPNDSDDLFVSVQGNTLSSTQARRSIKDAAVATGIMEEGETEFHKKFTPHTYRTVFTTLMRKQGMSDYVLQYIRGDSNRNTADIYTRIDRDEAKEEYLECIKPLHL